ncbi:MAG: signal peptidase II [Clostridia bacterium]|nr:signal peptidase II [Clostridia bacterium]
MTQILILIGIIVVGVGIDQLTKALVVAFMQVGDSIPLIPGFLHLTFVENDGMAFGLADDSVGRVIFMVVSTIAIIGIGVYLFRFCKERMLLKVGLAMIISGGIGNMIDRIFRYNVVDMIDFCGIWKYVFNVADAFVCVGAGVVVLALILDIIKDKKNKKSSPSEENNDGNNSK